MVPKWRGVDTEGDFWHVWLLTEHTNVYVLDYLFLCAAFYMLLNQSLWQQHILGGVVIRSPPASGQATQNYTDRKPEVLREIRKIVKTSTGSAEN